MCTSNQDQDAVKAMLLAASKMRGVPPQMLELVAGLGEVWSAQTLAVPWRMVEMVKNLGKTRKNTGKSYKNLGKTRKNTGKSY